MTRRLCARIALSLAVISASSCGTHSEKASAPETSAARYITAPPSTKSTSTVGPTAIPLTGRFAAAIPVGSFPTDVWLSPADAKLYVCNSTGRTITTIDTMTNRAIATLQAGQDARQIIGAPDGKTVFVTTNESHHPILAIDTATGNIRTRIMAGDEARDTMPRAMAIDDKAGILYVATEYGKPYIAKVDLASNRVLEKTSIRWGAADIVFDAARNLAYASSGHAVLVVDGASNAIMATIPIGAETGRLALDQLTHNLFVVTSSSKSIEVLDTSTFTVTGRITLPSQPYSLVLDSAGHIAYVTAKANQADGFVGQIHVVDTATGKVVETLPAGNADVLGLTFEPTSHRLYVVAGSQDSIVVLERPNR